MAQQLSFLADLEPAPRWVRALPNSGHRFYQGGERFLVREDRGGGYMLCWRDGQPPAGYPGALGLIVHERYVEDCE